MSPELWQRVRDAFAQCSALDPSRRAEFLDRLRAADPEAAPEVERMLAAESAPQSFLEPLLATRPPAIPAGRVLAERFEIRSLLGAGGAGEVYRVFDRQRACEVALKIVHGPHPADLGPHSLRNELRMATLVSHPNVCRLFDITVPQEDQGLAFISMELLEGETLEQRLKRGPLPPAEASAVLTQLVAGLEAAHQRGIVHRDLKPGNIMLTRQDGSLRVVIMDFGLAREMKPGEDYRTAFSTDVVVGTPHYMAPEQLQGKHATLRADLHALGVIMFEMATGIRPFDGATPIMVASARLHQDPPRPRSVARQVSPAWEYAILRCLERDPLRRPASAAEVLLLASRRPPLRLPWRAISAAAALLIAVLAYFLLRPYQPSPAAQTALDGARVAIENHSREGFLTALDRYRQATTADPRWALPWAEMAYAYATAANSRFLDGRSAQAQARACALRALALDSSLAKAHGALGWTQSLDFDQWPLARQSFERALRLTPDDWQLHYWFAVHLRKLGRFHDAELHARRALALSRQRESTVWIELAFLYWTANRLDRMRAFMNELHGAFPNVPLTRYLDARLLKLEGRYPEAERELDLAAALDLNRVTVQVERASLEAYRGNQAQARAYAAEVAQAVRDCKGEGLLLAGVYARLADPDPAFASLNDAYRCQDSTLLSLPTSPVLEPLRTDPRYQALLEKLHYTAPILKEMEFQTFTPAPRN